MKKIFSPYLISLVLFPILNIIPAFAAEKDFIGDWMITLEQGNRTMDALLSVRNVEDGVVAYIEGGPTKLKINGNNIEVAADDWTGAGRPFERYFKGTLAGDQISGTFAPEAPVTEKQKALCERLPLGCPYPTGTWVAERYVQADTKNVPPQPVDISGRWSIAQRGLRRWTLELTEKGKAWNDGFDVEMDLPAQRCVSSGLVMGFGGSPEIFQSDNKITMILGSNSVRRIYLDDRKPGEFSAHYPLGFSSGRWEGSTLVVETTHLLASVRGFMGDHVSENARVIERMTLSDDGLLTNVMALHDPEYYKEPLLRRVKWRRNPDETVQFPSRCDPDSFYRQVYEDGRMDEYIKRSDRRY